MARRKLSMNEYLEMVYQWHRGRSVRQIRDSLRMSRKTIHKYLRRLAEEGLSRERPLPEEAELAQRVASVVNSAVFEQPARERIRPYHQQIVDWLSEPDMTLRQVQRLLEENHELGVSYMSVHRYVRSHIQPLERPVTVRLHPPAGEQAQVDFGYAGLMRDPESGKLRRAWAFILILSHSRHRFVRFVFRQDNRTWLDCHIRALKFFGGCPTLIVLDNLKNGVLRPDLYDPTLNPAYAELERHYGFVADPAKVARARHKGKVERCVPVVRQHLLEGLDVEFLSRSSRIQNVRLGRALIGPVVVSDLKGRGGMLVGAPRDPAQLFLFEFSQVLADGATGLVQSLRQVALTKDKASRAPFGAQREVNKELKGAIGEFLRGGLPAPVSPPSGSSRRCHWTISSRPSS